jgi:hypothetical protein
MRGRLRGLQAKLRGQLDYFELEGGGRHWYDPQAACAELFLHGCACLRAGAPENRPEPPEIVRALARAKDRRAALEAVAPSPLWPYEYEAFFERGELVHRSMVSGQGLDDSAWADLSEPGEDS